MFQMSIPRIRLRVVLLPGIPCSFLLRDTFFVSLKKPTKVGIPQKKRARILCEGKNKAKERIKASHTSFILSEAFLCILFYAVVIFYFGILNKRYWLRKG